MLITRCSANCRIHGIADGGYAREANATTARLAGVTRSAFHKRARPGFHAMGVKRETLKNSRTSEQA